MGYLPICVDLTGRNCLVVGGGGVAERKVTTLLELGACVKVISPRLTEGLERRVTDCTIRYEARTYRRGDLIDQHMVFVATDNEAVNQQVAGEASGRGIWVNVADDPANCDFILPAILRRGPVMVAVSTGGASPALARLIREQLEELVTEDYGTMVECAAEVRRDLRGQSKVPTASAWSLALDPEFRALAARGDRAGARRHLLAGLIRTGDGQ